MTARKLRILWVDEQLAGIQHFIDVLEFQGHNVEVVEDATTALELLQQRSKDIDLAIIDVMLPPGHNRDLFPNGETDEGVSTGVLLVTYLIEGKRGQFAGSEGMDKRILIFSGAGIERITKKIRAVTEKFKLHYLQKRLSNDPILVADYIRTNFS
jgi:CheY-like chemotaxis protein